ncbi:MAG: M48 family metallopeptidase [Clostridiales bacterium]|nr:M48 family metallopeptidase [Clostridiales bacterium]
MIRRTYEEKQHVTGNYQIPVTIRYGKLKRLRIHLDENGRVVAHAPKRVTLKEIDQFIESNLDWIDKQRRKQLTKVRLPRIDEAEQRRKARIIKARASAFLAVYDGKKPSRIFVRNMSSRWGSCSSKGNISLNVYLLDVEPELFEYVLIHELSHLYHMNHSRAFWAQVARYCPDYKACRAALRKYEIPKKEANQ